MKRTSVSPLAFASVIPLVSVLAGCGQSQSLGAVGTLPHDPASAARGPAGVSRILREARGDLLYVATGDNVYVLSYPGGKLVRSLGIPGNDLCSNAKGDVFVPTSSYQIDEFDHNGQLIQRIGDVDVPLGCAVDPTTGNLAVTNAASGAGYVAVFPNAKGPPQSYYDAEIGTFGLCAYDSNGNLYVDGTGSGNFLAELRKGSSNFINFTLGAKFDAFGSVQWDGSHLTITNPSSHEIYRVTLADSSVKIVGTTQIRGWHDDYYGHWPYVQTWIQGNTFIAQSSALAKVGLWSYPQGGRPSKITGPFRSGTVNIYGVTVSIAAR
jgi:DNA-binding beta-propeller fold protein YncE